MINVLALDPGVATGLYYGGVIDLTGDLHTASSEELTFDEVVDTVSALLSSHTPDTLTVVAEKFTFNSQTAKKSPQPASLEVIGATKALMHLRGWKSSDIIMQTPGAAKRIVSNDMLRDCGAWHVGGAGHANDAARHAVLYLLQHGWRPQSVLEALEDTKD